jgi:hypothetical protein
MTPDRRSQVGGLEFHADESALADALPRARDVESVALAERRLVVTLEMMRRGPRSSLRLMAPR